MVGVVGVVGRDTVESRTNSSLHVTRLSVGSTIRTPEVDTRRRGREDTRLVADVLLSIGRTGVVPDRSPVIVRVDAWVGEDKLRARGQFRRRGTNEISSYVDGGVILSIEPDGEVDPVALRWEPCSSSSIPLNKLNHIRRADAALEAETRSLQRSSRKNHAAVRS